MSNERPNPPSNVNHLVNSVLTNSPVTAGDRAKVRVFAPAGIDPRLVTAMTELRRQLDETESSLGAKDDDAREAVANSRSRLEVIEHELAQPPAQRDSHRIASALTRIRESVVGFTALAVSVDGSPRRH